MFEKKNYHILCFGLLSLTGILVLAFATKWGAGISPDSATYIGAARSLLEGKGLNIPFGSAEAKPITHYPPLYPLLLSAIGILGPDPQIGARWLNILLFGANILIAGLIINRYALGSILVSLLGSFLILSSVDMLAIHAWAWAEPLFIFFGFSGLYLLARYLENPKRLLLLASSAAIALAFLTRYPGIAFVATGIVGLLFLNTKTPRDRIRDACTFLAISSLPTALWMTRNMYVAESLTNRKAAFHPITANKISVGLHTVSTWIVPTKLSGVSAGIIIVAAISGVAILHRILAQREEKPEEENAPKEKSPASIPRLTGLFVFFYMVLLAVSISFFDAHTALNSRIMSPVFFALVVSLMCLAYGLAQHMQRRRATKIICVALSVMLAAFYLYRGSGWVWHTSNNGLGFSSKKWQQSKAVRHVKELPEGILVFSNAPDALYTLTGRSALWIPAKVDPGDRQVNQDFSYELAEMKRGLEQANGVVVYLDTARWRWYLPLENELVEALSLRPMRTSDEGTIYELDHR